MNKTNDQILLGFQTNQDSFLEYFFFEIWRSEKRIALSEKKPLLIWLIIETEVSLYCADQKSMPTLEVFQANKGGFFSESAIRFSDLQISKKKYSKKLS